MGNGGITFVILGATGDLTKRKLIPAICRLIKNQKIKKFALLGAAKTETNIKKILKSARPFVGDYKTLKILEKRAYYQDLDFYKKKDFQRLEKTLADVEKKHNLSGKRIFYLATLPQHFDKITHYLDKSGIAKETKKKWCRVVYEKPFGDDLKSAKKINRCINRVFREEQVYRIDHYLGKELVGNISIMRFTNRILEPLWCGSHIESVQIILSEKIGAAGRGRYYDRYGALKDVVQNHALQLLALTTMETPNMLAGEEVRNEKAKVLEKTRVKDVLLGQYQGYKKEKDVKNNSNTETLAVLHLEINNQRWKGVPFFIKTGKNLDKKETAIVLKFKPVDCLLARNCPSDTNHFTIKIEPNSGFELELHSKVPGKKEDITPVKMEFCQECRFGPNTPEAYETLLKDVIKGDQSFFVRNDEIEYAWKVIDKIKKKRTTVYSYDKGSKGPDELEKWSRKHKIRWRK